MCIFLVAFSLSLTDGWIGSILFGAWFGRPRCPAGTKGTRNLRPFKSAWWESGEEFPLHMNRELLTDMKDEIFSLCWIFRLRWEVDTLDGKISYLVPSSWAGYRPGRPYAAHRHTVLTHFHGFAVRVGYSRCVQVIVTVPGLRGDLVWLQTSDWHTLPFTGLNLPACLLIVPFTDRMGDGPSVPGIQNRSDWTDSSRLYADWGKLTFSTGCWWLGGGESSGVRRRGIERERHNLPRRGFDSVCAKTLISQIDCTLH